MHLKELIEWLEKQDPKATVKDGFGSPHSDRGYYEDLGFDPVEETTFGEMLAHAKSAMGATFTGWRLMKRARAFAAFRFSTFGSSATALMSR